MATVTADTPGFWNGTRRFGRFLASEMKPRGRILTPFNVITIVIMAVAAVILFIRFTQGLGAVTNLSDGYPWGLWIAFDVVTGTALGCGGYAVALLVYAFNKGKYHPLVRPALLTSALGYSIAAVGIIIDVGRPWLIWRIPISFSKWNLDSALLEVALCVMAYMIVLWIELVPPALECGGHHKLLKKFNKWLFVIISLGIVLPTMHQSGLGAIVVAAGNKVSPLWQTPWVSFLFLLSAIIMGFSVVIFEGALTVMGFGRRLELHLYRRFAKVMRWALAIYLVVRFADLAYRGALGATTETPVRMTMFMLK